jgi:hypothetical protein
MTDTTAQERGWGKGWPDCQGSKMTTIHPAGRAITCRTEAAVVFSYYVSRYDAEVEDINSVPDDGAFACRPIRGSEPPVASNHSWGLALDLNWQKHPLGESGTFTAPQLLALRLMLHEVLFMRWGGDYEHRKDEQHHEFMGTPSDMLALTRRVKHLMPWQPWDGHVLKQGMSNDRTRLVNNRLGFGGTSVTLTSASISRLRGFQSSRHLPVTGVVDERTWRRLQWRLP